MSTEKILKELPDSEEKDAKIELLNKGNAVHAEAGSGSFLKELVKVILEPNFRDVMLTYPKLSEDGTTSLSVWWNTRPSDRATSTPLETMEMLHDQVSVGANPETGELTVEGSEEEKLESGRWRSDNQLLKEAIRRAIHNPMTKSNIAWHM